MRPYKCSNTGKTPIFRDSIYEVKMAILKSSDPLVLKVWENKRKHEKRICIWFEDVEYLVVLAIRKGYILLWTAYPVTRLHRKRKLQKEYEAYIKANAAPV